MSLPPLSSGSLARMNKGDPIHGPILQIIDLKVIQATTANAKAPDRYRMVLSDGSNLQQSMLSSQLNPLVKSGQITINSVFRLDEFSLSNVKDRKIIVVVKATPLGVVPKIGNPMPFDPSTATATAPAPAAPQHYNPPQQQAAAGAGAAPTHFAPPQSKPAAPQQMQQMPPAQMGSLDDLSTMPLHPVRTISPYQNKWVIKVRVTSKSAVREWSNSKGSGRVFSVDLVDQAGDEIRASAFTDVVDKFYPLLNEGSVYLISRCSAKVANKRFTSIKHDYELTLSPTSIVQLVADDASIGKSHHYSFVPIDQLEARQKDESVDVIGVMIGSTDPVRFIPRSGNGELCKRTLTLVDTSSRSIEITLWGDKAERTEVPANTVIAVRGAKVSDFNTKSLSTVGTSYIEVAPDIPEAATLRTWFDSQGGNMQVYPISVSSFTGSGAGGAPKQRDTTVKTIAEAQGENMGMSNDGDFFNCIAAVTLFRTENTKFSYTACNAGVAQGGSANRGCQAKVEQNQDGTWFCKKCGKTMQAPNDRYLLNFSAADHTGSLWLTAFHESALKMVGGTEASALLQMDDAARAKVFNDSIFQWYSMRVKCKLDSFKEESRLRYTVLSVEPLKFADEAKRLATVIEQFA